jgi:hypothetical protein
MNDHESYLLRNTFDMTFIQVFLVSKAFLDYIYTKYLIKCLSITSDRILIFSICCSFYCMSPNKLKKICRIFASYGIKGIFHETIWTLAFFFWQIIQVLDVLRLQNLYWMMLKSVILVLVRHLHHKYNILCIWS